MHDPPCGDPAPPAIRRRCGKVRVLLAARYHVRGHWSPDREVDPFEGLTFRIRESKRLKVQNRTQNMLILGRPDHAPGASAAAPFAIVGSSYSPYQVEDVELFAKQRIAQTAQISDLTEIRGEPREIAAKPAYEITAKARDLKSGIPLSVYQMLVVDGDTYYLVQERCRTMRLRGGGSGRRKA